MGIRESLEKLGKEERDINLRELSFNEKAEKEELVFDVEKEISSKEWERICLELELLAYRDNPTDRMELASDMKILFPDKFKELNFDEKKDEIMAKVLKYLENLKEESGEEEYWANLPYLLFEIKIVFPDMLDIFKLDEFWPRLKDEIDVLEAEAEKDEGMFGLFVKRLSLLRALYPKKISELGLDNALFEKIKKNLDKKRKEDNWRGFSMYASEANVLFPERFKELGIVRSDWQRMKEEIKRKVFGLPNEPLPEEIVERAIDVKIAAAAKIIITNDKFELVMEKEKSRFKQEKLQRPERRE